MSAMSHDPAKGRPYLVKLFDPAFPAAEDRYNNTVKLRRTQRLQDGKPRVFMSKTYDGPLQALQQREQELLWKVGNLTLPSGEQLRKRVCWIRKLEHVGEGTLDIAWNIEMSWHGFDLADWAVLLGDGDDALMRDARFLLAVARSALKALHLLHQAGWVHCDITAENLCLPFFEGSLAQQGDAITGRLNADNVVVIDLGLSLSVAHERSQAVPFGDRIVAFEPPFSTKTADGQRRWDALPDDQKEPYRVRHPALLHAHHRAKQGDLQPLQALDWRIDLWALGRLIEQWSRPDGLNPYGTARTIDALRTLAIDLLHLGSDSRNRALPHADLIAGITALLGAADPVHSFVVPKASLPVPPPPVPLANPQGPQAGQVLEAYPGGPKLVVLPKGSYQRGSEDEDGRYGDEGPVKKVTISHVLALGQTEVTRGQFGQYVDETGDQTQAEKAGEKATWRNPGFEQTDAHPVVYVSWVDANKYIEWLNKKAGQLPGSAGRYRLPSESEWEYGARDVTSPEQNRSGAQHKRFFWGDDAGYSEICKYGNAADQSGKRQFSDWTAASCDDGFVYTAPVGSFKPSPNFKLYDMVGNAWEWTQDCKASYDLVPTDGSAYEPADKAAVCARVLRGGSWSNFPRNQRPANRNNNAPDNRNNNIGFRLARTPCLSLARVACRKRQASVPEGCSACPGVLPGPSTLVYLVQVQGGWATSRCRRPVWVGLPDAGAVARAHAAPSGTRTCRQLGSFSQRPPMRCYAKRNIIGA